MTYYGYKVTIYNGYPSIYLPSHKRAYSAGWVYVHILQAEKMLGRDLNDFEVVHHEDEDRMNFDFSNLVVFASDSDHRAYHNGNTRVKMSDGTYICHSKYVHINNMQYKKCVCGNLCVPSAYMCRDCYNKLLESKRVDRDLLKDLIRNNSFEECGRILGCSGNAVKKKCKSLGLPHLKSTIKSISDDDWLNL